MNQSSLFKKILAFLIIIIFVFCFLYYIIYNDIKLKNKHTSELQNSISHRLKQDQYMSSVKMDVFNANSDIEKISNSIVSQDGDVVFIELLENIAKNNGLVLTISSLAVDDTNSLSTSTMTTLDIRAKLNGSWKGTYLFLSELESLPYNIRVDRFSLVNMLDNVVVLNKSKLTEVLWSSDFEIHVLKYK